MQYPTPITDAYLEELKNAKDEEDALIAKSRADAAVAPAQTTESTVVYKEPDQHVLDTPPAPTKLSDVEAAAQADTPDVRPRFAEKKRLIWSDKTCMSTSSVRLCFWLTGSTLGVPRSGAPNDSRQFSAYNVTVHDIQVTPLNLLPNGISRFADYVSPSAPTSPAVKVRSCFLPYFVTTLTNHRPPYGM